MTADDVFRVWDKVRTPGGGVMKPPSLSDMIGIWAHPEGTEPVPCSCCGTCTCDFHGGETHGERRWCSVCIGRGHHEDES